MSARLGAVKYGQDQGDPFLGRSAGRQADYSLEVAHEIDEEVRKLIETAHTEAYEVLNTYRDVLDDLVMELLEKETLQRKDLERIFATVEKRPHITVFNEFGERIPSDKPPIKTPGELAMERGEPWPPPEEKPAPRPAPTPVGTAPGGADLPGGPPYGQPEPANPYAPPPNGGRPYGPNGTGQWPQPSGGSQGGPPNYGAPPGWKPATQPGGTQPWRPPSEEWGRNQGEDQQRPGWFGGSGEGPRRQDPDDQDGQHRQ
jgi:cell division protease FtsH